MPSELLQQLSFHGEVVEILEREGRRVARVRVDPRAVLEFAADGLPDLHLGDRLLIDGSLAIDVMERVPDSTARSER